ncbi:MAG: FAD-dependent oxidoreductase [Candidatus Vogelbacteria bacterium]
MTYDLSIIGGGPAGVAAGVYAARKKLRTIFLTDDFGGQSVVSAEIQNWIGTPSISGEELAKQLENHLRKYEGENLLIKSRTRVEKVEKAGGNFSIKSNQSETYESKTVLVTTGAHRRKLTVPGAETFEQKGITYCASCDAPLFADKAVAVIGGGNAAFETAVQLLAYASQVTILHHSAEFKADAITIERVLANPKVTAIKNAETIEVKGEQFVSSLIYQDKTSGAKKEIPVEGIFVEIGFLPTTGFVKDLVTLNKYGSVVVDPRTQRASLAGIWSAGDCTDSLYHQNNIATGDAIKALEDIYNYLHLGK